MLGQPTQTWLLPAVLMIVGGTLGGCVTGTEVSYGQYQYDPYGRTERVYERSVYADPSQGIQSETCQSTVRSRVGPFGGEFDRRTELCEETPAVYGSEPLSPNDLPPSVYQSPNEPPLPSGAIPDTW